MTYLTPDRDGMLDPEQVAAALRPDTVLVSIMHVNNEIGVIQDIAAIASLCAQAGSARLHVDAAQSVGKCDGEFRARSASTSCRCRRTRRTARRAPEPWSCLAGAARSCSRCCTAAVRSGVCVRARWRRIRWWAWAQRSRWRAPGPQDETERIARLQNRLWHGLASLGGVLRNGGARSVPHLLNVSFEGVEGESLLAAIRPHIAVSTGSACTSATQEPSYVLRALGRDDRLAESSLRFSLGRYSSEPDIDTAVAVVGARRRAAAPDRWLREIQRSDAPLLRERRGRGGAGGARHLARRCRQPGAGHLGAIRRPGRREFPGRQAVQAVRFLAFACPHVIAVSAWVAEQAVGRAARAQLPDGVHVAARALCGTGGEARAPADRRGCVDRGQWRRFLQCNGRDRP